MLCMRRSLPVTLALASSVSLVSPAVRADPEPTAAEIEAAGKSAPEPERYSTGMMYGGGVLITLGAGAAVAAIVFFGEGASCHGDFCGFYTGFGAGFAATSVLLLGVGIPLAVVGSEVLPPKKGKPTAARPEIRIGPGSAALEWRF